MTTAVPYANERRYEVAGVVVVVLAARKLVGHGRTTFGRTNRRANIGEANVQTKTENQYPKYTIIVELIDEFR